MFNFFKKAETFDPVERGGNAVRYASKLAQLVPFRYLLGSTEDGSVSFKQYTGVFVEQDKVHILNEKERAAVAGLLADLRCKNTPAEKARSYTGFIPWKGGECPVSPDSYVTVQIRGVVKLLQGKAGKFNWGHKADHQEDIVAYRADEV